jgi:ribosomal protein S18 acetylase RimI-like enzyme
VSVRIRPIEAADRAAIARICRLTGRAGEDATGDYGDDDVLADVYATPYVVHDSGFGVVAVDEHDVVVGYLIGTTDTLRFSEWFVTEWWPSVSRGRGPRTLADASLFRAAEDPARMRVSCVGDFPAHLHIDLLDQARGAGAGRRLVDAATAQLRDRGVPGVHLVVSADNPSAVAFYRRTGFTEMADDEATIPGESIVFARSVGVAEPTDRLRRTGSPVGRAQPTREGRRSNQ